VRIGISAALCCAAALPGVTAARTPARQIAGTVPYDGRFTFTRIRYAPPTTGPGNVLELEDPEIFRNPILYVSEPGYGGITDEGSANLRRFLLKGGFLILDGFEANQWYDMVARRPGPSPWTPPTTRSASGSTTSCMGSLIDGVRGR